jgi:hypothetical protein
MWPARKKSPVEDFCGVSDECSDFITAHSMLDEQLSAFVAIPFMIVYISKWYWLQQIKHGGRCFLFNLNRLKKKHWLIVHSLLVHIHKHSSFGLRSSDLQPKYNKLALLLFSGARIRKCTFSG